MKSLIFKYKYEILLLVIGFLIVESLNFLLQLNAQNIIYPDSESYFEAAQNLYLYQRGHNYRPIFLALIQGIPFLFNCSNWQVYKFCFYTNFFFWIATAILIFKISKAFLTPIKSFGVALLSLFFVGSAVSIYHLLSENCYLFFIVWSIYFLQKYYQKKQFVFLSIAVAILIITMLIRPGSKLLAICFVLFYAKEWIVNYKKRAMLLIYASTFLVLVQCAGLRYQFGNFTISYIDSVTYYNYLGSKALCIKEGKEFNQMNNPRGNYIFSFGNNGKMIKKVAYDDLLEQVKSNAYYLGLAFLSDIYDNSTAGNTAIMDCVNVKNTTYFEWSKKTLFFITKWQNRMVTILGFLFSVYCFFFFYKKEKVFSAMAFFVLYTVSLSGISCSQGDRFHLVVYPFILLLVAKFWSEKIKLNVEQLQK